MMTGTTHPWLRVSFSSIAVGKVMVEKGYNHDKSCVYQVSVLGRQKMYIIILSIF